MLMTSFGQKYLMYTPALEGKPVMKSVLVICAFT